MPKINKFSGLFVPGSSGTDDSDEELFNQENVKRYRQAQLKLDCVWMKNEKDIATSLSEVFNQYNKKGITLPENFDYPDVMDALEEIYSDENSEDLIQALETIAKKYGYVPEMDNIKPAVDVTTMQMFWHTKKPITTLLGEIYNEHNAVEDATLKDKLANKIDGGFEAYRLEKEGKRPKKVHRGELWRAKCPMGVGNVTNGYRWIIIISNESHAKHSNTVNVVYLASEIVKNELSQMEITNDDLKSGAFKETENRVNITDIHTIDKLQLDRKQGIVSDEFMKKLMERIASQIGIK